MDPVQVAPVEIDHVFSVENDPRKIDFILKEHTPRHMFQDVSVFKTLCGFCLVCQETHKLDMSTCAHDVLIAGTSCKGLSRLNNKRKADIGCFERNEHEEQSGTSGPTYLCGFKLVPWINM